MIPFNLERALAGEKVVNKKGNVAGKIVDFGEFPDGYSLRVLIDGEVGEFTREGKYFLNDNCSDKDLFMVPNQLGGFVNLYAHKSPTGHKYRADADKDNIGRVACIDLSQFEEGHGL